MTDALKDLIARDEWLEVAKAITFAYVNAPKNPAKFAWVSAVEEGPYHIETNDSAANGGQGFKAICGVAGDFNFHLTAAQIFPSQKCKSCLELAAQSSANILDVAPKGVAGVGGGNDAGIEANHGASVRRDSSPADSVISDRHGDDRFADNILRACEGLPQNGDDLEEIEAAEEGAAIEASNLPDPAHDPRFA